MDFDTAILLAMTVSAYCWYISFGIIEERKEIKAREREAVEGRLRRERVNKLFGK